MASKAFTRKKPLREHLVRGSHGLKGEVADLRKDVDEAISSVVTAIKTAAYTPSPLEVVPVNPTAGGFTINLPTAVGLTVDDGIVLVNVSDSANVVTVDPAGGETINGSPTYAFSVPRGTLALMPLNGNWVASPPA